MPIGVRRGRETAGVRRAHSVLAAAMRQTHGGQTQVVIGIRRASAEDATFLSEVLAVAADWRREVPRPTIEVLAEPALARYVTDWPRDGDVGFIADDGTIPVGAAWWRTFTSLDPGYGFIDEFTPEVSIGVLYRARRRGVGTRLLHALIDEAQRSALPALSLSVEPDNPAASLYRHFGFDEVSRTGGSLTMALRLTR
jgi:ribosomal protein S18 acetylase RimI-like enzyme